MDVAYQRSVGTAQPRYGCRSRSRALVPQCGRLPGRRRAREASKKVQPRAGIGSGSAPPRGLPAGPLPGPALEAGRAERRARGPAAPRLGRRRGQAAPGRAPAPGRTAAARRPCGCAEPRSGTGTGSAAWWGRGETALGRACNPCIVACPPGLSSHRRSSRRAPASRSGSFLSQAAMHTAFPASKGGIKMQLQGHGC